MSAEGTQGTDGRTYYTDNSGNITVKDSGGGTVYSGSGSSGGGTNQPVTDMSQWYRETQASQGYKPTEQQVSAAMDSYKSYLAGRGTTNPNDNRVWNTYGEVIGYNPSGGGYTDYSYQAANARVNPSYQWTPESRNDPSTQRFLTSTPLRHTYYDYDTKQLGYAPADLQAGFPGFINKSQLGNIAQGMLDDWSREGVRHSWDLDSLSSMLDNRYYDLSDMQGLMNEYAHEFYGGVAPNVSYNPNSLYGDAYTKPVGYIEMPKIGTVGKEPWEVRLDEYRTNTRAGYDEIARAQQVYNQKMAEGDVEGAERAHIWANQIRDAMGISSQFDRVTGAPLGNYQEPTTMANDNVFAQSQNYIERDGQAKQDIFNQQNPYLQAMLDEQRRFAERDRYVAREREPFRQTTQPFNITSDGTDVHIPTLAAKQQWEREQDALQKQHYDEYAVNYDHDKNIYTTSQDWLKLAMQEEQRIEQEAKAEQRYQEELALAQEQQRYDRALAMWNAGIATDEIYRELGIPAGSKPFAQMMQEWQMELAERDYGLKAAKASGYGSGGGGGSYGGSGGGGSSDFPYYDNSQGERENIMTGRLLVRAEDQYQLNKVSGGNAGSKPLYYALDTMFHNPEWEEAVTSSGADAKRVADQLIIKYTGKSPMEYFTTDSKARGSRVEKAYKNLLTPAELENWYTPIGL